VDDSIVRGNTQRAIVRMLREAGAASVHIKISSPPVKWPCFYGIDFASRAELIANGATIEEISQAIGADSLAYISEDGMIGATRQPRERLCTACFTGKYPIELPHSDKLGKNLLERTDLGGLPAPARTAGASTAGPSAPTRAKPAGTAPAIPLNEDPAEKSGATGCDPGPDAEFEELLTDADRVNPADHSIVADKKEPV
jgi:amidophosphoribosyltransferase